MREKSQVFRKKRQAVKSLTKLSFLFLIQTKVFSLKKVKYDILFWYSSPSKVVGDYYYDRRHNSNLFGITFQ